MVIFNFILFSKALLEIYRIVLVKIYCGRMPCSPFMLKYSKKHFSQDLQARSGTPCRHTENVCRLVIVKIMRKVINAILTWFGFGGSVNSSKFH